MPTILVLGAAAVTAQAWAVLALSNGNGMGSQTRGEGVRSG